MENIGKERADEHAKIHDQFFKNVEQKVKGSDVEKFLINKNDSLITKKKKIRKIHEICLKRSNDIDSLLLEDISKYLELYEENCKLMLNSRPYLGMK